MKNIYTYAQTILSPQCWKTSSWIKRQQATLLAKAGLLMVLVCCTIAPLQAQMSGSVFRDYNGNGTRDANEPFVPGVTVNAYDASNTLCGTATTVGGNTAPNYTLTGCGTSSVRVEFVLPAAAPFTAADVDYPSLGGINHGTSVQFVNGNSTNVNFAISDPDDYNTGPANVMNYIPCYVSGDPLPAGSAAGAMDWFVGYPYTNQGSSTPPALKVGGSTIGATWGVAYSNQANRIFTSAFIKRHVGLGTLGSGGIYMLEPTATSFNAMPFYDLDANGYRTRAAAGALAYGEGSSYTLSFGSIVNFSGSTDLVSGEPIGLGVVGVNGPGGRNLPTSTTQPSFDPAAFDQVGKVGLGGLEISDDGRFLFVMNLYSKSVFRLELDDPYNPTSVVDVTEIPIPVITCNNGVLRPFALSYHRGQLYAGAVCTGENGGTVADMFAYVFQMNNANTSTSFTTSPILSQSLDYIKGFALNFEDDPSIRVWRPWTNEVISSAEFRAVRSVPVLSDIDFANNGQMILNFFDRTGHKYSTLNYARLGDGRTAFTGQTAPGGEIWVAGLNATTGMYQMENAGAYTSNGITFNTAPAAVRNAQGLNSFNAGGLGGLEFFYGDYYLIRHYETSYGSSAYLPGEDYIQQTLYDPDPTIVNAGGTRKLNLSDGASNVGQNFNNTLDPSRWYQIFSDPTFGKANGLGELELLGFESPLEIGNRVWVDTDNDGIQDADEAPIPGVEVQLWKEDSPGSGTFTQIATVTTNADGEYYFSSATGTSTTGITYGVTDLLPEMNYELRFPTTTTVGPNVLSLTAVNMGGTDPNAEARDSDADISTGIVSFMTGGFGSNDHNFDVGFRMVANLDVEKTFVSAVPNGDGTFTVEYTITVMETNGLPTTYDLTDTPGFDDDITINSGSFSGQNTGTLTVGVNSLATGESIAANATHTYNLTFNVTLDLADGAGDNIYNPCDATTPTPGQGLYNLATLTTMGMSGDADACGDLSVITHEKALTSVSAINGDGSYDVSYTITVTHLAGIEGQYDLTDIPNFDDDFTINNASFTSSAPPGLSGALATTMGTPNILGDDVNIAIGATHTYTLNFNITLNLTDGLLGDDIFTTCGTATPATPQAGEGLFNRSTLDVNNDGIPEEIREVCTFEVCPTGNCGQTTIQNN